MLKGDANCKLLRDSTLGAQMQTGSLRGVTVGKDGRAEKGEIDQNSLRALKKTKEEITLAETIEEVDLQQIQPFTVIPDYKDTTTSPYPFVVKTPECCLCIDGQELIDRARSEQKTKIMCYVFYLPGYSEAEVAIRKVANRTLPRGGRCSYAELVRNITQLFRILLESQDNLMVYAHGGDRKGLNFTENKAENVRKVLADRLAKDVGTINSYLNHRRYIDDQTMDRLVNSKETKGFFESAQPNKRLLVKNLTSEGKPEEEIAQQISQEMLNWCEEYHEDNKIAPVLPTDQAGEDSDESDAPQEKDRCKLTLPTEHDHWQGNTNFNDGEPPTEESVCNEWKQIAEEQVKCADDREIEIGKRMEMVKVGIIDLTTIYDKFSYISRQQGPANQKEGS